MSQKSRQRLVISKLEDVTVSQSIYGIPNKPPFSYLDMYIVYLYFSSALQIQSWSASNYSGHIVESILFAYKKQHLNFRLHVGHFNELQ